MKRKLSAVLFLGLLLVSCGKKNNGDAPVNPYYNPVTPVIPNGQSLDINVLRSTFENGALSSGVIAGDYLDKVSVSGFSVNFSFNFFGKVISSSNYNPVRSTVTGVDSNYIDLSDGTNIDRTYLMDKIFSDNQPNYSLRALRACIFTQEYGVIPAVTIEKYNNYGGGWGGVQNQYLVERVVVSTAIPLYLNPVMVETTYKTSYIRRYKSNSAVINVVKVGNCY